MAQRKAMAAKEGRKALGRAGRANSNAQPMLPLLISSEAPAKPRRPMKISDYACQRIAAKAAPTLDAYDAFRPYEPAKGVLPEGRTAKIAMDEAGFDIGMFAGSIGGFGGAFGGAFNEGMMFPGYPVLAEWSIRPENRQIVSTRATEMTRKWIKFVVKGDGDSGKADSKHERIAKIEDEFSRLQVRDRFRECVERDGYFGRAHLHLDTGHANDPDELKTTIGNGRDAASRAKVSPERPLKWLTVVEPMWTYPAVYNSFNPLDRTWYRPEHWYVMGRSVHVSRLLRFCSQEVPDVWKPAYAFGGLSMSQMAKPYVDNWLKTRQIVQRILGKFSQFVLKTNMTEVMGGMAADNFMKRLAIFNATRNNDDIYALDKEMEDFVNVAAPLAGLDHLQAQAQEHLASVSRTPLVILTGISPSGLNASGESEMDCWSNLIHSEQENLFRDPLTTVLDFVQLSLFGDIDQDIDYEFLPIVEQTEEQKAALRKTNADTDAVLIETGVISQHEARARVANDADSPYADLDIDEMPDLEGEEEEGLMPSGEAEHAGKPKVGGGLGGTGKGEGGHEEAPAKDAEKLVSEHWTGKGSKPNGAWLGTDAMALDRLLAEAAIPKTLYVSRPLENAAEFRAWAKSQGFKSVTPAKDLHVTIAYSKTPIVWESTEDSFDSETVPAGGPRAVEKLGDAVVLRFQSKDLTKRWKQFKDAGASWDHDSYKPHISITYDVDGIDLDEIEPYTGPLEFGPEVFDEVKESWKASVAEDEWKEGDPRAPDGRFGEKSGEHGSKKAKTAAKEKAAPKEKKPAKAKAEKATAEKKAVSKPSKDLTAPAATSKSEPLKTRNPTRETGPMEKTWEDVFAEAAKQPHTPAEINHALVWGDKVGFGAEAMVRQG